MFSMGLLRIFFHWKIFNWIQNLLKTNKMMTKIFRVNDEFKELIFNILYASHILFKQNLFYCVIK